LSKLGEKRKQNPQYQQNKIMNSKRGTTREMEGEAEKRHEWGEERVVEEYLTCLYGNTMKPVSLCN
jgi:hypothetical protein